MAQPPTTDIASMAPASQPLGYKLDPGTIIGGVYCVEQPLGMGGAGEVYRATHLDLGRAFAVKVLVDDGDRDAAWRLVQEAKTVSAFSHDHIVDVVHLGRDEDGPLYVVMELLEGEDLRARLARAPSGEGLASEEAREVLAQALQGLAAAHDAGVIHRDVKPANLYVTRKDERIVVKLLDFGMSRCGTDDVRLTRTGQLIGTPLYMAPEQSNGAEAAPSADVYSWGVVAYEVLTGVVPFPAASLYECVLSHAIKPPPPLQRHGLPPAVATMVERCLAKDPAARFASGREALLAFEAAWTSDSVSPGTAASTEPSLASLDAPTVRGRPAAKKVGFAAVVIATTVALAVAGPSAVVPVRDQVATTARAMPRNGEPAAFESEDSGPLASNPVAAEMRRVASHPPGALVSRVSDGEELGTTPLDLQVDESAVTYAFSLDGHIQTEFALSTASAATVVVELTPTPSRRATRRPVPPRRTLPTLAPR